MEALPQAAAIWMIMLLVVAVTTAVIALPRKAAAGPALPCSRSTSPTTTISATPPRWPPRPTARRSTAQRCREAWERARQEVDAAWADYDRADREARRAAAATAYPVMRRRRPATRTRSVSGSCTALRPPPAATGRSPSPSSTTPSRTAGGTPGCTRRRRSRRCAARSGSTGVATYQRAAERERQAWETAEEAAELLRSLRAEACAATVRDPRRRAVRGRGLVGRAMVHRANRSGPPRPEVDCGRMSPVRACSPGGCRTRRVPSQVSTGEGRRTGWRHLRRRGRPSRVRAGPPAVVRLHRAARIEDAVHEIIERRLRQRGWQPVITAYTGYGAPGWARVMGRVVLTPAPQARKRLEKVRGWRSFTTSPVNARHACGSRSATRSTRPAPTAAATSTAGSRATSSPAGVGAG